ncbi:Extracellular calcium-sensing receptor [Trichoplax sp. H2]|nr:Extracellular calcium-sensing receptor [Trichoplax sp. H2]|eukprot:RDD44610.1 Extracellular calcium-sensing receptor [Trichoplax sp. H2]
MLPGIMQIPTSFVLHKKICLVPFWITFHIMAIAVSSHQKLSHLSSITLPGDIILGGLFDIHLKYHDLTGQCHEISGQGLQLAQAMIYAIQKINSDSKLLPNVTLGYKISDSCNSVDATLTQALAFINDRRDPLYSYVPSLSLCPLHCRCNSKNAENETATSNLIKHPVTAVIGTNGNEQSIATATLFSTFNIAQISYASTIDKLSNRLDYKTFFRTVPSDSHQAAALFDIIRYFNWTYVALIAIDDGYGNNLRNEFLKLTNANAICVPIVLDIPIKLTAEQAKGVIDDVEEQERITTIIAIAYKYQAQQLLQEAQNRNLTGKVFIGTTGWGNALSIVQDIQPSILEGGYVISLENNYDPQFYSYLTTLTSGNDIFNARFEINCSNRTGNSTLSDMLTCHNEDLFYQNDGKAGYVITAVQAVAHALHAILNCTDKSCDDINFNLFPADKLIPYLYRVYLQNSSSPIFNSNGNGIPYYVIKNFQRSHQGDQLKLLDVGYWNGLSEECNKNKQSKLICQSPKLVINKEKIAWFSNTAKPAIPLSKCSFDCLAGTRRVYDLGNVCCWNCVACDVNQISNKTNADVCFDCSKTEETNPDSTSCIAKPVTHVQPKDVLGIAIIAYSSLTVFILLCIWIIIIIYRSEMISKTCTTYYILDNFLLISILAVISNTITMMQPITVNSCNGVYFLFFLSIAFLTVVLMTRILLLCRLSLVKSTWCQLLNDNSVAIWLMIMLALLALQAIIFFMIQQFLQVSVSKFVASPQIIYNYCSDRHIIRFAVAFAVLGVLIIIAIVLAKKAPKMAEEFIELRWTFNALVVIMLICIGMMPPYLVLRGPMQVCAISLGTTTMALITLVINFAYKIYHLIRNFKKSVTVRIKPSVLDNQQNHAAKLNRNSNMGIDNHIFVVNTQSIDSATTDL